VIISSTTTDIIYDFNYFFLRSLRRAPNLTSRSTPEARERRLSPLRRSLLWFLEK